MTFRTNKNNSGFAQQGLQRNYNDLDIQTRYLFAEYEMAKAFPIIHQTTLHSNLRQTIENTIIKIRQNIPTRQIHVSEFASLATHPKFGYLRKQQEAEYFRFNNVSYRKITETTGISPNTIAKLKYDYPYYLPLYNHWTEEMLQNWDTIAKSINIFQETLVHYKSNLVQEDKPLDIN